MLPNQDGAAAVHVQPAFATAYHRSRLQANAVLLRYGHIIPVVAVLVCLIISTSISIYHEVNYSREAAKDHTTTTPRPSTPNSTAVPKTETSSAANSSSASTVAMNAELSTTKSPESASSAAKPPTDDEGNDDEYDEASEDEDNEYEDLRWGADDEGGDEAEE